MDKIEHLPHYSLFSSAFFYTIQIIKQILKLDPDKPSKWIREKCFLCF